MRTRTLFKTQYVTSIISWASDISIQRSFSDFYDGGDNMVVVAVVVVVVAVVVFIVYCIIYRSNVFRSILCFDRLKVFIVDYLFLANHNHVLDFSQQREHSWSISNSMPVNCCKKNVTVCLFVVILQALYCLFFFRKWKKNRNPKFLCLDLVWMILFPGHYEGTWGAVTARERQSPQLQTLLLQSLIL